MADLIRHLNFSEIAGQARNDVTSEILIKIKTETPNSQKTEKAIHNVMAD